MSIDTLHTGNKKRLVPVLRFNEFEEEWINKNCLDLFINSREKGNSGLPIYSVTLKQGMVPRNSLNRKMGNDAKATDNLLVRQGDISYNMMRMWQGAYGFAPEKCMVSPAYVVLHPKDNISAEFFIRYFDRSRSHYLFTAYSYGLTSDRLRLYFKDFARIKFATPKYPEQKKIATFLYTIDKKIQQLTRKKELLEAYKKGLMQQLFSGELRFKDEEGKDYPDWEHIKLKELTEPITKGTTPKVFVKEGVNFIKIEGLNGIKINKSKCLFIDEKIHLSELKRSILKENDILFAIAGSVGKIGLVNSEILPANTNQAFAIIRLKELEYLKFILQVLDSRTMKKYIYQSQSVGAQPNLNLEQMGNFKFHLPSREEQQKIANFFSNIDTKIETITTQITKTQTFKKGLLQQMFV